MLVCQLTNYQGSVNPWSEHNESKGWRRGTEHSACTPAKFHFKALLYRSSNIILVLSCEITNCYKIILRNLKNQAETFQS